MKTCLGLFCVLVCASFTTAVAQPPNPLTAADKPVPVPELHPGTPDGREGGETIADAFPIPGLPFLDHGSTTGHIDDYDETCPFSGSTSPDVVYAFTSTMDSTIDVDLCGSSYDTKVYAYDESMELLACNDDYYFDAPCGQYVSKLEFVPVQGGEIVYIVVDGYGGDHGDYVLSVYDAGLHPYCDLECPAGGSPEGEPPLTQNYVDLFNSGCGQDDLPFQDLVGDASGELVFCGHGGWFPMEEATSFDTDWFTAIIGPTGVVSWHMAAEYETLGAVLGPRDCDEVGILQSMFVSACEEAELTITGTPGDLLWLWVGPAIVQPPSYYNWQEYSYISTFHGLDEGVVTTEPVSLDRLKSLYR